MKIYYQNPQKDTNPRTKLKIFLIVLLFLALIGAGGYLVYASGFFKVKNIEISGLKNYSKENLTVDLKDFFKNRSAISSFLGPENVLVWTADVGAFLSKEPQFKNLIVQRDILGRFVKIEVQEREKFGIWCLIKNNIAENTSSTIAQKTDVNENCFWFDKDGIIFVEAPTIESELFNKVADSTGRDLKSGDKVLDSRLMVNLVKIFNVFDEVDIKSKTAQLNDLKAEEVVVRPLSFPVSFFSLRFSPDFSIAAIKTLKKDKRWDKIQYADFRVENRVYYKYKNQ
ncbi:MAG: hypothetical protein M1170_01370 [Patescibacteria group bacterium]|nr:hypothetical protein [Patescibacteria group bacterium]